MPCPWRHEGLGPRLGCEEQLLQVRSGHPFQPAPLLYGTRHGGFHPALGDDLRPFGEGGIEELAEPSLGVLDRPLLAHSARWSARLFGSSTQTATSDTISDRAKDIFR